MYLPFVCKRIQSLLDSYNGHDLMTDEGRVTVVSGAIMVTIEITDPSIVVHEADTESVLVQKRKNSEKMRDDIKLYFSDRYRVITSYVGWYLHVVLVPNLTEHLGVQPDK